jgi:hypothetical protein
MPAFLTFENQLMRRIVTEKIFIFLDMAILSGGIPAE